MKGQIDLDPIDLAASLPDISKFPITVKNTTNQYVEIFSSIEKAGTGIDGWLTEAATDFNKANIMVNGKPVSVKIRNIASGTATDYIKSGKYVPDAFTPSNEFWGEMVKASGVKTKQVSERLVGNVPGIVIAKPKYDALIDKYGAVNVNTITEAIANNEFSMGYTDPFARLHRPQFSRNSAVGIRQFNMLGEKAVRGSSNSRRMCRLLRPRRFRCGMLPSRACWTALCWSIKYMPMRRT